VLGAFAVLAFNFVVLPRIVHRNPVIQTPDLRGLTVEEAAAEVAGGRLRVEPERTKNHPTIPAGRILEQVPEPQTPIRRGRVVRVVTSRGPSRSELPDMTGLSLRQAQVTLQREALRVGRVLQLRRSDVTVPTVAFQSPSAGSALRKGTVVDLVVAVPNPPILLRMPDLRGAPLYAARQAVAAAGCVMAPVNHERTTRHPPNLVLSQTPPPGQRIEKGARIELVASTR
jgi:serine/threonine-protein kinase